MSFFIFIFKGQIQTNVIYSIIFHMVFFGSCACAYSYIYISVYVHEYIIHVRILTHKTYLTRLYPVYIPLYFLGSIDALLWGTRCFFAQNSSASLCVNFEQVSGVYMYAYMWIESKSKKRERYEVNK